MASLQTFDSLPPPVSRHIFSLVPVDSRLRCAEVCRAWRAALEDRSLWTRLDMPGMIHNDMFLSNATWLSLFRCAVARAGGELEELDFTGGHSVPMAELEPIVSANAGTLRELRVSSSLTDDDVGVLLRAARVLEVFEIVSVVTSKHGVLEVCEMLRNESPLFAPLRMLRLAQIMTADEGEAGVVALAAGVAAHASLQRLDLHRAALGTAVALDALVDAAILRRLHTLECRDCSLTAASIPALVRLIEGGALTVLKLHSRDTDGPLLDAPGAALLAAALRGSTRFAELHVTSARLWDSIEAGVTLVNALVGHQNLSTLHVEAPGYGDEVGGAAGMDSAARAFGALVAANAPALRHLYIPGAALGDEGLAPIFAALPSNTHLCTLDCTGTGMSEAFVRDTILPAVRANRRLDALNLGRPSWTSAAEAQAHVSSNYAHMFRLRLQSILENEPWPDEV